MKFFFFFFPLFLSSFLSFPCFKNNSYNEHTAALASTESQTSKSQFNSTLLHDYSMKVNSSEFSDVKFLIDGKIIYAHKIILAARSLHFNAMFSSGMREAFANEIEIPNVKKKKKTDRNRIFVCLFVVVVVVIFCPLPVKPLLTHNYISFLFSSFFI